MTRQLWRDHMNSDTSLDIDLFMAIFTADHVRNLFSLIKQQAFT